MRPNSIRLRLSVAVVTAGIASVLAIAQNPAMVARYTATTSNVSGAGDTVRIEVLKWSTDAERDQFLNAFTHPASPAPPAAAQAAPAGDAAAPAAGAGGGRGGGGAAGGGRGGGARGAGGAGAGAPAAAANSAVAPALPPATDAPAAAAAGGGARGGGGRGGGAAGGGGRGGGAVPGAAADVPAETPDSSLLTALQKVNSVAILWTSESAGYSIKYAYRIAQPDGSERIIFATDRRLGNWSDQWWKPMGATPATNLGFTVIEFHLPATGDGEGRTTLTGKVMADTAAKSIAVDNYVAQPVIFKGVKKAK
jgi:hypothetical protein